VSTVIIIIHAFVSRCKVVTSEALAEVICHIDLMFIIVLLKQFLL